MPAPEFQPPDLPAEVYARLPRPNLPRRPLLVDTYRAAWGIAMARGIRQPLPGVPGGLPFLDACFSENIFQWDSCFITLWARYAQGAFPGLPSVMSCLDNFYALQQPDGAIAREYRPDGTPVQNRESRADRPDTPDFARHSAFTNPPLFSWAEWEYFEVTGDDSRLARVLPVLSRYFDWYFLNRARDNGTFWYDTFGSGMDNLPRPHAHGWVDYTAQAALDCEHLANIALQVGDEEVANKCAAAYLLIKEVVNEKMWSEADLAYLDIDEDGFPAGHLHAGCYWTLMANLAAPERVARMCMPLRSYRSFARTHRIPALPAHVEGFQPDGGYWRGGVWPPIVAMVVRALERTDQRELAHQIALNHVESVAEVYRRTGTIWENYAPDAMVPGNPAKPHFCGWSALGPVALLIESVLGIRVNAPLGEVIWTPRLEDAEFGIENLRVGGVTVDLHARSEKSGWQATVRSTGPLLVTIRGLGGTHVVEFDHACEKSLFVR